jgi:hypothetical protein
VGALCSFLDGRNLVGTIPASLANMANLSQL